MNCRDSILERLAARKERRLRDLALTDTLTAANIVAYTGHTKSAVNSALHLLVRDGKVERLGTCGFYRFRLRAAESAAPL